MVVQPGLANYGAGPERRDHNDVRAFAQDGQELLDQEKWAAHVRRKEIVKILGRMIFDGSNLADSRIGHEHIQALADDRTNFLRQQRWSFRSPQVRSDRIRASGFRANAGDKGFRILGGTTVVNQNMRTGVSKRGCGGTPNSP